MFKKVMNKINTVSLAASAAVMTSATMASANTTAASGAADFKAIATNLNDQIGGLKTLVLTGAGFAGICLVLFGLIGLKNHSDNPQQNPLKGALVKIVIGGMLLAPLTMTSLTNQSVTGGSGDTEKFKTNFNKESSWN